MECFRVFELNTKVLEILAAEDLKILNQHFNKEGYLEASLLSMLP